MKKGILIMIIVSILSCTKKDENLGTTCTLNMENYDYSYGIEYDKPEKYLVPGEQSDLDSIYFEEIRSITGTPEQDIAGIKTICNFYAIGKRKGHN